MATRKRHNPEQIVRKLREAEAEMAGGATLAQAAARLGVSEQTFHRWRNQYGGMKEEGMKRLKELEEENRRLKRVVADQALDIQILRETARGNF
jgi:transposase-like protein